MSPRTSKIRSASIKQLPMPLEAEDSTKQELVVTAISLEKIIGTQSQPRRHFDPQAMQSLVESVRSEGILQPLWVKPVGEQYRLVAGERRFLAAQEAGLTHVPAIIREMSDEQAIQYSLVENLQREDLTPIEETDAILQLLALRLGYNVERVSSLLYRMDNVVKGKITRNVSGNPEAEIVEQVFASLGRMNWQSFVRARLPLLKLPPDMHEALCSKQIEYTKAKEIAKLESELERQAFLEEAISLDWTVNQIRERIQGDKLSTEGKELEVRMQEAYKLAKKLKLWDNPKKRKELEALLSQLEALISADG